MNHNSILNRSFKALLTLSVIFSSIHATYANTLKNYNICISDEKLNEGQDYLNLALKNRMKQLKDRRALIEDKENLLESQIEDWSKVQERMLPASVATLAIPGLAVGKLAAAWDYSNIARTAYATSVISKEMVDYILVGSMTTILVGGLLLPTVYSKTKYSVPNIKMIDCNSETKVVVFDSYDQLKENFIKRTNKNEIINELLTSAEKKIVNKFDPGFWHFIKNASTFGLDEATRLSQLKNALKSQYELVNQELTLLDEEISQIKNMKACSRACEITVD